MIETLEEVRANMAQGRAVEAAAQTESWSKEPDFGDRGRYNGIRSQGTAVNKVTAGNREERQVDMGDQGKVVLEVVTRPNVMVNRALSPIDSI